MMKRKGCGNPECGCDQPTLTDPVQALKFLSGRMKFAGISKGVANWYATDIDEILAKYDITFTDKDEMNEQRT